jgi:hypothetical protein
MTTTPSRSTKREPPAHLSIPRTILAIVLVTLIIKFISRSSVLFVYVVATGAGGPDLAAFRVIPEFLWSLLSAFGTAVPFVVIFGISKEVFDDRWVRYGLVWSFLYAVRWVSGVIRSPESWVVLVLGLFCSVFACVVSAYVTRNIFRRPSSAVI